MTSTPWQTVRGKQRAARLAALGLYVLASAGVPLPAPSISPAAGSYPCAGRGCGCISAEMCARSCCCHSRADRVAWYRARNLRVPSVLAEARTADPAAPEARRAAPRAHRGCCASRWENLEGPSSRLTKLSAVEVAKCRGQSAAGPGGGPAMMPSGTSGCLTRRDPPRWAVPDDERATARVDRPETPPPRV